MPIRKTIVCLANSKKLHAYCVAGVEPGTDTWIRPIGSGDHGAITAADQTLADGTRPKLLDLIRIRLDGPTPQLGQPENWALARGRWKKVGALDDDDARDLLVDLATDEPLFGTNQAWLSGKDVQDGRVTSSLAVVQAEELSWTKKVWPEGAKIRGVFKHAGSWHDLSVTDLAWIAEFSNDDPGEWDHVESEEVFLVVSLAEADPRYHRHYKLIAGVIGLPA